MRQSLSSRKGDDLGTDGLVPGDTLMVADPRGTWLYPPDHSFGSEDDGPQSVIPPGTTLIVVEGDPGTHGVLVTTFTGKKLVVTDLDVRMGVVTALGRGGLYAP